MIAEIANKMLEHGTKRKSKLEVATLLEDVGASITFSMDEFWSRFSIRCMKQDISLVLQLLAEQLREPSFDPKELELVKKRTIGILQKQKENNSHLAYIHFRQTLYPTDHPLYFHEIDEQIEKVKEIQSKDLIEFHEAVYGLGNMIVAVVGDIGDEKELEKNIKDYFSNWKKVPIQIPPSSSKAKTRTSVENFHVEVKDKPSLTLYLGHPIGINRDHEVTFFHKRLFFSSNFFFLKKKGFYSTLCWKLYFGRKF